jgi:hypothetical protein
MSQTAEIILSKDQFNSLKNSIKEIENYRIIKIIDEETDYPVIRFYEDNDLMEELLRENDLWDNNVLFDAPSMDDDTEF